jgi:hypothetical protein
MQPNYPIVISDSEDSMEEDTPQSQSSQSSYAPSQSSQGSQSDYESQHELVIRRFIDYVGQFLTARADDVEAAYDSNGGWEPWLHVELHRFVTAQGGLAIEREPNAYARNNRLRADFAIDQPGGGASVPVEIKCETQRESAASFKNRSSADSIKVTGIKGWALVFAIAISGPARKALSTDFEVTFTDSQRNLFYLVYTYSQPS